MSLYSDLETAIVAAFQGDTAIEGMTKTIEANLRDCLFTGMGYAQGFRPQELPAIQVSASLDPVKDSTFTTAEIQKLIPLTIVAVTAAADKKGAHDSVVALQVEIARILNKLRRSDNALGMQNTLLFGDVTSSTNTFKDGSYWFGQSTTQAVITSILPV